jgi:hypothetical protein
MSHWKGTLNQDLKQVRGSVDAEIWDRGACISPFSVTKTKYMKLNI